VRETLVHVTADSDVTKRNATEWPIYTYDADATQLNCSARLANNAWSVHSSVTSQSY